MALRTNCIEYAFTQKDDSLAAATRYDFAAITLQLPENTSRTFRSVIVEVSARDDTNTTVDMTSWLIGIKLGAAAFDDVTVTETLTSGEHWNFRLIRDVTSYFNTNFGSGTSQTCQVGVQFGASTQINVTAKLIIHYEYDDSGQTTRCKTVRIPIESLAGALSTTLSEIGTNQVPLLDTFCPESTKTFDDIFFEIEASEASTSTTDAQLGLALDSESEVLDGVHRQNANSSPWYRRIWKRTDMATNSAHAFKARTTASTVGFNHMRTRLVVTYRYDHSATSSVLNHRVVAFGPAFVGGTAAANAERQQIKFFVEEPGTIALVQSAVELQVIHSSATSAFNLRAGSQAYRAYTMAGTTVNGTRSLTHRVDSGGAQGAGMSIARGENTLTLDHYVNLLSVGMSARALINYTSGKHSNGVGAHAHTVAQLVLATGTANTQHDSASLAPNIPETNFWVDAAHLDTMWLSANSSEYHEAVVEQLSGEGSEDGFKLLGGMAQNLSARTMTMGDLPVLFERHPTDPDTARFAVETSRVYRLRSIFSKQTAAILWLTYHAISFSVAGTVSGYTGDGSGITVEGRRKDTDEKLNSATTSAGGSFSMPWYDDTIQVSCDAQQDGTHVGRSADGYAS